MRFLLIFFIFILTTIPTNAAKLKGNVSENWTVEKARKEAFQHAIPQINMKTFPAKDPHLILNMLGVLFKKQIYANRVITTFNEGYYSTKELKGVDSDKTFYYDPKGNLIAIDFDFIKNNTPQYPKNTYKHLFPDGKLIGMSIKVKPNHSYTFNNSGKLLFHWIGNKGYNEKNELVQTRK